MFIQINEDNKLVAWGGYPFPYHNKEVAVDYDDYNDNPDKYIYDEDSQDIVINPGYSQILLEEEKAKKIKENDSLRDKRILAGVEYKGLMWDCDTDQKINLIGRAMFMNDGDTETWYAMDTNHMDLTKAEMMELGNIIGNITTAIWQQNFNIKYQIENAKTVADVQKIYIDYNNLEVGA